MTFYLSIHFSHLFLTEKRLLIAQNKQNIRINSSNEKK